MPSITRKQANKTTNNNHSHSPSANNPETPDHTTETIIRISTWNQNTRYSPTSAIQLATQNEIDILTIQEPNQKITDPHTHEHMAFNQQVTKANYTAYYSLKTITLLRNSTIQPYHRATHKPISQGRIHPLILTTSPSKNIAIINIYAYQRSHKKYSELSLQLLKDLDNLKKSLHETYENLSIIISGDLNINHNSNKTVENNILKHVLNKPYNLHSAYTISHPSAPLPATLVQSELSHIDYILLPSDLPPIPSETHLLPSFTEEQAPSDHYPLISAFRTQLYKRQTINHNLDATPRYSILSSIPIQYSKGCHPDHPDDDNYKWFIPSETLLDKDDLIEAKTILANFITTHEETETIQTHVQKLNHTLDQIQNKINKHTLKTQLYKHDTDPTESLIPRTQALKGLITKAYEHFQAGIDLTFKGMDYCNKTQKPKSTKHKQTKKHKQTNTKTTNHNQPTQHKSTLIHSQNAFDKIQANLLALQSKTNKTTQSKILNMHDSIKMKLYTENLATFTRQTDKLLVHLLEKADRTIDRANIVQSARTKRKRKCPSIQLRQQNKNNDSIDTAPNKKQRTSNKRNPYKTKKPTYRIPQQTYKYNNQIPTSQKLQQTVNTIKNKIKSLQKSINKLQQFVISQSQLTKLGQHPNIQQLEIMSKFHHQIKTDLKRMITLQHASELNLQGSFGLFGKACELAFPKPQQANQANIDYPNQLHPHQEPIKIPAVGPQDKLNATKLTQHAQMRAHPGKANHFTTLQSDEVGPSHIQVRYCKEKSDFTEHHLKSYHEHSDTFSPQIKKDVVKAHEYYRHHLKHLISKHKTERNKNIGAWPFYFRPTKPNDNTVSKVTFSAELPNLIEHIRHIPTKARYKGFTLNVIARMHPDWLKALSRMIPIILTIRILPQSLKTTGRTLIDKPGTTDKRPISVLQALDSFLDTTVNEQLANAVERTQILDHTIAAYRKGRSCNDLSLNNIMAIQDTINHTHTKLAHIDEDKEKYFDRISTELQMLPFHIISFPPSGYSEWIAESLSNLTIETSTPYGTVTNAYECGVRQGSALSCTIANMVAWLSSSAWLSPIILDEDKNNEITDLPHDGYTPHIVSPNIADHTSHTQLDTHSFCDDASRYLTATSNTRLESRIHYNLKISGYMSIVNKLGVRADKSRIRLYNMPPGYTPPNFYYTAWNHSCRSVNTKKVPTDIHYTDGTITTDKANRNLGVHNTLDGSTDVEKNNKLKMVKLQRARLLKLNISHQLFPTLYSALVTSHAVFNPLAIAIPLTTYLDDDIAFLPKLKQYYNIQPNQPGHPIYLSTTIGGYAFKSIVSILLQAYTREILVLPNCPPKHQTTPLHILTRSLLHSPITHPSNSPNSVYKTALICADAGYHIRHNTTVVVNYALDNIAHTNRDTYIPVGARTQHTSTHQEDEIFTNLLTQGNRQFNMGSTHHQALLYTFANMETHYLDHDEDCGLDHPQDELFYYNDNNIPASFPSNARYTPQYYEQAITAAHTKICNQYTRLLYFKAFYPTIAPNPKQYFKEEQVPHPDQWEHIAPVLENENITTNELHNSAPLQFFKNWTTQLSLDHPEDDTIDPILTRFTKEYNSPFIFASDGSHNSKAGRTSAASVLVAIDNKNKNSGWQKKQTLLIQAYTHLLPTQIGTLHSDINHAEAHACILSHLIAPLTLPSIILVDSRVIFNFIFTHFFPNLHTERKAIRHHYSSISYYYSGLLTHLLDHHHNSTWSTDRRHARAKIILDQSTKLVAECIASQYRTTIVDVNSLDIDAFKSNLYHASNQDDILNPTPLAWMNKIRIFKANSKYYIHVNSHQLTDTGQTKKAAKPLPNYAIAHANAWADVFATKLTKPTILQTVLEHPCPNKQITHPPIVHLQYSLHHDNQILNGDTNKYVAQSFANEFTARYSQNEEGWIAHHYCDLHDPDNTLQTNQAVRNIILKLAPSHHSLLKTNRAYHKTYAIKFHLNQRVTRKYISTEMLRCPLCDSLLTTTYQHLPQGDIYHLHTTCPNKDLSLTRYELNKNISEHIQTITHIANLIEYIANDSLVNKQARKYPTFQVFLRSNLTATHERPQLNNFNTLRAPREEREPRYHSRTIPYGPEYEWWAHPSFITLPHFYNRKPTLAHKTYLTPLTPDDISQMQHSIVDHLPLTGLLPTLVHQQITMYFNKLYTHLTTNITLANDVDDILQIKRKYIHDNTVLRLHKAITDKLPPPPENDKKPITLKQHLFQTWTALLRSLVQRPQEMQNAITTCLLQTSKATYALQTHLPPPPPPTPTRKTNPETRSDESTNETQRTCSHPRCNLRSTHGDTPNPLTPKINTCIQCRAFDEALSITILIETQLRINRKMRKTLAMALPTISAMNSTPQSYMRTIQYTTITKYELLRIILDATDEDPTITKHLKTRMYFTRSLAGENQTTQKYQTTATVLHLILRVLAHPTPPCYAPEIPATNHTDTILAIAKALTPCQCTSSGDTPHQTTPLPSNDHICHSCNHLIFTDTPTNNQPTQQYYPTCAVCQESHDIPYETRHPCQTCIILGLLSQRRTKEWWPQHTTYIHPSQESNDPSENTTATATATASATATAANFPHRGF